jgi:hypothetical protein
MQLRPKYGWKIITRLPIFPGNWARIAQIVDLNQHDLSWPVEKQKPQTAAPWKRLFIPPILSYASHSQFVSRRPHEAQSTINGDSETDGITP